MKGFFSIAGLRRLRVMTWKELLQLFRDTALMVFFLYSFTGDIYVAASGVSMQLRNAALAVLDNDRSFASRELASRFQPPYFKPAGEADPLTAAVRAKLAQPTADPPADRLTAASTMAHRDAPPLPRPVKATAKATSTSRRPSSTRSWPTRSSRSCRW